MEKSVDPKMNISTIKMKATLKFGVCYVQILGPWENSKHNVFLDKNFFYWHISCILLMLVPGIILRALSIINFILLDYSSSHNFFLVFSIN